MSSVEEKLAASLTAENTELIPHLPYLLQDLWDLGSSPRDMLELITKEINAMDKTRVLDLACGKGAVSVHLAKETGCQIKGIDIMPDFIAFASKKALEYRVEKLCEFKTGDINEAVNSEKNYDLVILGAVGDVLGTPEETIVKLKKTVKPGGYILIDDAYGKIGKKVDYYSKQEWLQLLLENDVNLINDKIVAQEELVDLNILQQKQICKRANELKQKYPEAADLFEGYIKSQQAECDMLENDIIGVTMLLQKIR